MTAYYNEIDPYAAQWLRNLIVAGHIAPGVVDERSIEDVSPDELAEYTQCHFFAGVGVWSYALRQAGWPDDRPVWTGSCPCQPFSAAGKGGGVTDERHLWPALHHLITQCQPGSFFGEQVASKDGLGWLDLVQADLEGAGYSSGAVDLCAAGVGAPHIRQRLWIVAERVGYSPIEPCQRDTGSVPGAKTEVNSQGKQDGSVDLGSEYAGAGMGGVADTEGERGCGREPMGSRRNAEQRGPAKVQPHGDGQTAPINPGPTNGLWGAADWLFCRDGKWRPVEPGTSPLANGAPSRVGRLRAYGNAINAEAAQAVIESYMNKGEI